MRRPLFPLLVSVLVVAAVVVTAAFAGTVRGTAKADTLRGTAKADVIYGLAGNDKIYGNGGNDRIYPGAGTDTLACGAGVDTVVADAVDKVARDCERVSRPSTGNTTPLVGTRTNPIPLGTAAKLGDGWTLTVKAGTPDATDAVLAFNEFNESPAAGRQFLMVRVTATYTGPGSDIFEGSFRLRAVGAAALGYSGFENSCGDIPDELSENEVFTGGTISGNACWEIRASDSSSLVLYDSSPNIVPMKMFFALR